MQRSSNVQKVQMVEWVVFSFTKALRAKGRRLDDDNLDSSDMSEALDTLESDDELDSQHDAVDLTKGSNLPEMLS